MSWRRTGKLAFCLKLIPYVTLICAFYPFLDYKCCIASEPINAQGHSVASRGRLHILSLCQGAVSGWAVGGVPEGAEWWEGKAACALPGRRAPLLTAGRY